MNDPVFESLKRMSEAQAAKRPKCGNCTWFNASRCMRYPPHVGYSADDVPDALPAVPETWLCGEYMNKRTGETFKDRDHLLGALRSRVGELEDEIEKLKRTQE